MKLRRSISTVSLLFCAVSGIVGSGWLLGPFYAAKIAGPAATLSWVIGGILMMIIALTYAELASMLPVAGGSMRFLQFSHGTFASFTFGWIGWLASAAVAPIETMALMHYASNYLPQLMTSEQGTLVLTTTGMGVGAFLLFIMCMVNVMGAKFLTRANNLVVFLKLFVPGLTLITLLIMDFHASNFTSRGFMPYGWKAVLAALPSAGVIFSFIGYSPAIQLAGEAKNPQRAIPFAILGALVICIIMYVMLEIAFVGATPASAFAHGWSSLSFSGDSGPFAAIAIMIGAVWLSKIIFIGAAVSPFGTALIYTGSTARMTYALGQNGYIPRWLLQLNAVGVPTRIIVLNFLIGLVLFLPFPTWQSMMSFLVSALVLAYAIGPLSLGVLRNKLPEIQRPFKVPAVQATNLIGFYICNLIIYWTGWNIISSTLVAILLGYVFLTFYKLTPAGRKLELHVNGGWWLIPYLICIGVASYLGSFGQGRNLIPFGWDFLLIAAVTTLFYWISQIAGNASASDLTDDVKECLNL